MLSILLYQFMDLLCLIADNGRHLELGCKRPYLEAPAAVSEEHYFRSAPAYESPLLSHPYCADTISSREACMYGGMEAETGSGTGEADDLGSPPLNCNMWASMQPYPRYSVQAVEGVAYQPFAAHFANAATVASVVSPHCPAAVAMATRPQADLGVYNPAAAAAAVQGALSVAPHSSSSSSSSPSSSSPTATGLRDRTSHQSLYPRKSGSPRRPQRDFSVYPPQSSMSIRDASYQYQMGLSSAGTHWGDG